jgi:hypothetical protein
LGGGKTGAVEDLPEHLLPLVFPMAGQHQRRSLLMQAVVLLRTNLRHQDIALHLRHIKPGIGSVAKHI